MSLSAVVRLLQPKCVQFQMTRGHRIRGKPVGVAKTLQERIEEINAQDPLYTARTDIGLPFDSPGRKVFTAERLEFIRNLKNNKDLEEMARKEKLFVNTDEVRSEWMDTVGPIQIKQIADHYGIFKHLYGEGYFLPRLPLNIQYPLADDKAMPVYFGNLIKPNEAKHAPEVSYKADENSLWTLVMTGLDSHLHEADKEYVHWMVANIPGDRMDAGQVLVDYMQPIPARGTGFHRLVFVLYKQNSKIEYSVNKVNSQSPLEARTFVTRDWYQQYQDHITPAGLAFYQSDWDSTLTDYYHNVLQMKEPVYEYDFAPPYIKPQTWYPLRQPFNLYMDRYRDPKQINKEYLVRKLKSEHPLSEPEPPLKFPNAHPFPKRMPSWLKLHERKIRLGYGRVNDV